jgi:ribonuclease D
VSWRLIDSDAALAEALGGLPDAGPIAVDTEFMRRSTYYPQVALLQLCAGGEALLVDPLAVSALDGLRGVLTDPRRDKVLHSCSEDLEVFSVWLGVLPEPLIDTQRAAALLGEAHGVGYRALVKALLDIDLDKGETRSDWLRRPLSEAQCHYAAQDVLHLLPAWELLRRRAEANGRLDWVLEEGRDARRAFEARDAAPQRRIKGAGRLSPRQQAVLEAISTWREQRARQLDKPRGWVLDDKGCAAIARAMPRHREALAELGVLPPGPLRRHGEDLLQLVEAALATPEAALPDSAAAALDAQQRERVRALKETVRERATALGLAPEILLPAADIELLVREGGGEAIETPHRWQGWRARTIIEPLREVLR